jgi:hypothetical protein
VLHERDNDNESTANIRAGAGGLVVFGDPRGPTAQRPSGALSVDAWFWQVLGGLSLFLQGVPAPWP